MKLIRRFGINQRIVCTQMPLTKTIILLASEMHFTFTPRRDRFICNNQINSKCKSFQWNGGIFNLLKLCLLLLFYWKC